MGATTEDTQLEPTLGETIPNLIDKVQSLLEWMPQCSAGSSGALRRAAVEKAIEQLVVAWALARL